ncbi:MAG: succinylglutamate desuccinylase/aspartoacylase family protein [Bdellovibrionales bacterium]|nr:succinylglutamate desuccinylase/aspartoacylase family protein [Bdellovibrionales bacterium]
MQFLSIIGVLFLAATASASDGASRGDSGIFGPPYENILRAQEALQVAYPELVTLHDYGTSYEGRRLQLLIAMKQKELPFSRTAIVMAGATHGNEYLHIEDRLPAELLRLANRESSVSKFLNAGGVLVFVPIVNPDGYERRSRFNARGVDLNRDWDVPPAGFKGFKERESAALSGALEQLRLQHGLRYAITVDYHCCAGALLTPWSYTEDDLPEPQLGHHRAIGALAHKDLGVTVGATGQVLGYTPTGTSKDYYFASYGALAFTYEGRFKTEESQMPGHLRWWEAMLDYSRENLFSETIQTAMSSLHGFNVDL